MIGQLVSKGPGLRKQKSLETRLRIAQAGLRLFATKGYDETTLEIVALAAGISPRALYHHFGTKFDILVFFHDEGFVREIEPTMLELDASSGPYLLTRECLLRLVPHYETDTLLAADRIWHSTETLAAQKQLSFLKVEAAISGALGKIWPDAARTAEFRMIGMIAAGALRLAMETGRQEQVQRPLRERLEEKFGILTQILDGHALASRSAGAARSG